MSGSERARSAPGRGATLILAAVAVLVGAAVLWWLCARDRTVPYLARHGSARWIVFPLAPSIRARTAFEMDGRFSRSFRLDQVATEATLTVRAMRRCDVSINGHVVAMARRSTNWKDAATAEVAHLLRRGDNTLNVTVFNDRGPPALWLSLSAGTHTVETDELWTASLAGSHSLPARLAITPLEPGAIGSGEALPGSIASLRARGATIVGFVLIALALLAGGAQAGRWLTNKAPSDPDRTGRRLVGALAALIGALWALLLWNNHPTLMPAGGFDGLEHLRYVEYILVNGRLPWAEEGWSMFHPPLYYAVAAAAMKVAGLSVDDRAAHGVFQVLSLAFGLFHLWMILLSMRLLFPGQAPRQALGLVLAGFLPMQLYMHQYVTNEAAAAALASASFYLALRLLKQDRPRFLLCAGLGACLGGAMLTKVSTFPVVVVVIAVVAGRLAVQGRSIREWGGTVGATLVSFLVVCGWRYAAVWDRYGNPLIGNWDTRIQPAWWQDPGYQTAAYFLRFGRALTEPIHSALHSFADGVYATLWGDGMIGGNTTLAAAPPWHYDLMAVGSLLALVPTAAVLLGTAAAVTGLVRRPCAAWFLVVGVGGAAAFAVVAMSLKVASYAHAKAFYGMSAMVPFCAVGALGLDFLMRRGRFVRWIVLLALLSWSINAYASFWIGRHSVAAEAYRGLGLLVRGRIDQAVTHHLRTVDRRPNDALAHRRLGNAYRQAGRLVDAARHYERAVTVAPDLAAAHALLGVCRERLGRPADAMNHYRQAVLANPQLGQAHYNLANLLRSTGALDEALGHYRLAIAASPEFALAHANCGRTLAALERFEEATMSFDRAVRVQPKMADAYHHWGEAVLRRGDAAEAIRLARRAVKLSARQRHDILAALASAYAAAGRHHDAVNTAQEALQRATQLGDTVSAQRIGAMLEGFRRQQTTSGHAP